MIRVDEIAESDQREKRWAICLRTHRIGGARRACEPCGAVQSREKVFYIISRELGIISRRRAADCGSAHA